MVTTIGSTGMAVAAILGLFLDNIIPGTAEERGIAGYGAVQKSASL
jgi:solute carrier family 23 (nucleobase transporter), member 1